MSELTENFFLETEDLMTPKHSIPSNINSLIISGSKGRFQDSVQIPPQIFQVLDRPDLESRQTPEKNASNHGAKDHIFENLYQDAAKRSVIREKMTCYESIKREKEVEKYKSDKKLSKAESSELFERLNKEANSRQEKYEISKKIKEDKEMQVLKNPSINKSHKTISQDVVSRLLEYGENAKKKNEERAKLKKEREDEEIRNIQSAHKRTATSFSCYNSPGKYTSNKSSPQKNNQSFNSISSSFHIPASNSQNSPEKILKKIQNIANIKSKFTAISKRTGYRGASNN